MSSDYLLWLYSANSKHVFLTLTTPCFIILRKARIYRVYVRFVWSNTKTLSAIWYVKLIYVTATEALNLPSSWMTMIYFVINLSKTSFPIRIRLFFQKFLKYFSFYNSYNLLIYNNNPLKVILYLKNICSLGSFPLHSSWISLLNHIISFLGYICSPSNKSSCNSFELSYFL